MSISFVPLPELKCANGGQLGGQEQEDPTLTQLRIEAEGCGRGEEDELQIGCTRSHD